MKLPYRNLALAMIVLSGTAMLLANRWPAQHDQTLENQVIREGLAISLAMTPLAPVDNDDGQLREGQPARLQFSVREASSQEPVKGLHPAVWMDRQNPQEQGLSCRDRINSYLQNQLAFQPEINLNNYFVLALNDKASISVIDPIKGFGGTKLVTRIPLNSPGVDWVISQDGKTLYVATPLSREVAVITTDTWKVIKWLAFAAPPTSLALQPDGKYLWVSLDTAEKPGISVIDTEKMEESASINVGAGPHEFAFSADSRKAYVGNAKDKTISIIDITTLSTGQTIDGMASPVSLAFSEMSQALYAATDDGHVLAIGADGQVIANIDIGSPLKNLRFSADGRWGFALSQTDSKAFIIDASLNHLLQSIETGPAPDQVSFTDHFAYVRSTGNTSVSLLDLDALDKNKPVSVMTFSGGQSAPGQLALLAADAIVPAPERNAVIVANPADKTLYYYMEGMAAPMGNFENFGMQPMAAMIVNRSVRETAPGIYSGSTQLPPAGNYSVSVLLDKPPVYHCFSAAIAPSPVVKQRTQPVTVEYAMDSHQVATGSATPIRLKLNDANQAPEIIGDLQLLVFRVPGMWQQRLLAKPIGKSLYQVDFTPPEAGIYQVFVQSPSLNLRFEQAPNLTFRAVSPQIAAASSREGAP